MEKAETKQEIEEKLDELGEKIDELWNKSLEMGYEGWNWYSKNPIHEEYRKLNREYKLLLKEGDYEMEPIPDYGDKMTLEDFIECCECGGFIDYDGFGNYATENKMSSIEVSPSDIMSGVYRKDFPYIIWFNR